MDPLLQKRITLPMPNRNVFWYNGVGRRLQHQHCYHWWTGGNSWRFSWECLTIWLPWIMPKGILNANAVYIIIIVFLNNKEMTEWQIEKKNAFNFHFFILYSSNTCGYFCRQNPIKAFYRVLGRYISNLTILCLCLSTWQLSTKIKWNKNVEVERARMFLYRKYGQFFFYSFFISFKLQMMIRFQLFLHSVLTKNIHYV